MLTEEWLAENDVFGLRSADVEDAVLEGLVFVVVGGAITDQQVKGAHVHFFNFIERRKLEAQSEKLKLGRKV